MRRQSEEPIKEDLTFIHNLNPKTTIPFVSWKTYTMRQFSEWLDGILEYQKKFAGIIHFMQDQTFPGHEGKFYNRDNY